MMITEKKDYDWNPSFSLTDNMPFKKVDAAVFINGYLSALSFLVKGKVAAKQSDEIKIWSLFMGRTWTKAQESVINSRGKNLLVSAAAGSGKTAVLVERIIKMITDEKEPVDIDRLVVITFTRAAAAQMKQKISDELERLIEENPENKLYRRQYHLLGNAAICTIDSFCLNLVRSYFQKLDLDPGFRIADDAEIELIRSDCMDALMEKYYNEGDADFFYLVEAYCGYKSDEKLTKFITNLAKKADAFPWPKEWLDSLVREYEIKDADELDKSLTAEKIVEHAGAIIKGCLLKIGSLKALCIKDNGAPDYFTTLEDDERQYKSLLSIKKYSELGAAINSIKYKSFSTKRTGVPEIKKEIQEARKKYKEYIKKLVTDFYFAEIAEITDMVQKTLPVVRMLVKLTKEYLDLFAAKKREKNVLDFSDAEHFALEILWGETPEALELRKQYREIVIDEYQDSNNVQEYITNAIAGNYESGGLQASCNEPPYIFTVGDVKQSIYKFRNACPELFISKQKLYADEKDNGKLIILDNNFRSREEVLDSTNAVFMHVMRESIGGIDYDEKCSLKKGTDKQLSLGENSPYKTEVLLISGELGELNTGLDSDGKISLEARLVAYRIKELINKEEIQVPDEEQEGLTRKASYGDIVILLRTMKEWSSTFREVLESDGIPVFMDESDGFFKAQEVTLVLDLLKILDNPRQDVPFASVLHSCIAEMDEQDLAEIRIASRDAETFYDAALAALNTEVPEKLKKRLEKFFNIYDELDEYRHTASVSELIERIYDLTGLYHYYLALPDGERRKANLDMLPAYAVKFESTSYSGLFGFIRYYDKLKSRELDYGEAGLKAAGNSVRIMSIHKSKGLEFPIVFVCGMGKEFNLRDYEGDICISADEGVGMKYVDLEKRKKYPSLYSSVKKMLGTESIIGEEMRLLYVAMTRAKDKLIMTGYTDKPNMGTDYASLYKAKHLIDFVFPVLEVEEKHFITRIYSPENKIFYISKSAADLQHDSGAWQLPNSLSADKTCFDPEVDGKQPQELGSIDIADNTETSEISLNDREMLAERIAAARNYKYEFAAEEALPVKLSVSELKLSQIEDEFGENIFEETREFQPGDKTLPDFLKSGEELNRGADYGTLVHKCMQFIPMGIRTGDEIEAFLSQMELEGRLSSEERSRMPVNRFVKFMNSALSDRIRRADAEKRFYREKQFMILVEACRINPEKYGSDNKNRIPIQGVIDAMFVEDGELVILDYKTDKAEKGEEEKLIKLYKSQLDIYAQAAERLLGLKVKEKLLYSFSLGKTIAII